MDRDLHISDNMDVLRSFEDDLVDLIYLDPPFNSKKQYAGAIATQAEKQKFTDTWKWNALKTEWLGEIDRKNPALSKIIEASRITQGDGTAAYLTMMGIRLIEMQRVLKPSGSIYLHCDDAANSYLRLCMDAVFGYKNFKNSITWRRFTSHNDAKRFGRITDTILFYTNGDHYTWKPERIATELTPEELNNKYPKKNDDRGHYYVRDLTGPGISKGDSGKPWRGFNPSNKGRHWSVPLTGSFARWIEDNYISHYRSLTSIQSRLDALDEVNMIVHPNGRRQWPGIKRFEQSEVGKPPQNLILEPIGFTNYNKKGRPQVDEFTGWATQKPLELLRPLIKVSSNPGDLVLDPFCGCATACVAAELENRQWIGIDVCEEAETITNYRLEGVIKTDIESHAKGLKPNVIKNKPYQPFATPHSTESTRIKRSYRSQENLDKLYGIQRGDCPGCGNHYRAKDMHVDHIIRRDIGGDDLKNLQLLCGH